jgi:arsenite/tail-anchored protein-transporting ATPase
VAADSSRVRVILVTGKGGVGKTTLAASTALIAAELRARTLLVSTDAAHSLEDVLMRRLDAEPVPITDNLDGLQVDGRRELQRSWSTIIDYIRRLVGLTDLDRLHADELMAVPGLDQLVALARLRSLAASGYWDAIVVDCAPSADSLRLLSLPDVMQWYLDRLLGANGRWSRWTRRRIERTLAVPAPDDDVLTSVNDLGDELRQLRATLDHAATTARVVVTPERVVVAEAQRTLAYLALYGYAVDAILVNRVPGAEMESPSLAPWLAAQQSQLSAIDTIFAALPRLTVRQRMAEPVGLAMLREVGVELYDGRVPLERLAAGAALEITTSGSESIVRLPVTGFDREQIQLERDGDEFIVTLGAHRRRVSLPESLRDRDVVRAGLNGSNLEVVFGESVRIS